MSHSTALRMTGEEAGYFLGQENLLHIVPPYLRVQMHINKKILGLVLWWGRRGGGGVTILPVTLWYRKTTLISSVHMSLCTKCELPFLTLNFSNAASVHIGWTPALTRQLPPPIPTPFQPLRFCCNLVQILSYILQVLWKIDKYRVTSRGNVNGHRGLTCSISDNISHRHTHDISTQHFHYIYSTRATRHHHCLLHSPYWRCC